MCVFRVFDSHSRAVLSGKLYFGLVLITTLERHHETCVLCVSFLFLVFLFDTRAVNAANNLIFTATEESGVSLVSGCKSEHRCKNVSLELFRTCDGNER